MVDTVVANRLTSSTVAVWDLRLSIAARIWVKTGSTSGLVAAKPDQLRRLGGTLRLKADVIVDFPVAQRHHAPAVAGCQFCVVGHEQNGLATPVELDQQSHNLVTRAAVQRAGRLVGED